LLLEGCFVALLRLADLAERAPEAIGIQLATVSLYLAAVYLSQKSSGFNHHAGIVLGFSLLFRLTLLPLHPTLSEDVYRYRWEGMVQAHGANPYEVRPSDKKWAFLRDETYPRIPGRDFKAGYGPLTELIEGGNYHLAAAVETNPIRQARWFKLPAIFGDLGIMGVLCGLLALRGLPVKRVLVYSWAPLPVVEFWGTGHNDAMAVLFVVLALWAAGRERWTLAILSLALGAAAKLWPALLLPVLLFEMVRRGVRLRWQWVPAAAAVGMLCLPYRTNIVENARFMTGFVGGWRNNDFLYGFILGAVGDPYEAKYIAFGLLGVAVALACLVRWPLERKFLLVIASTLLISANCHPWYATWFLPLLVLEPLISFLLWAALMPLAYAALIGWHALGEWNGVTPWRWAIHGTFLAALMAELVKKRCDARNPSGADTL
jgi:alpha-1,6-mannosyltransferase